MYGHHITNMAWTLTVGFFEAKATLAYLKFLLTIEAIALNATAQNIL
jgi:hypothetical protein